MKNIKKFSKINKKYLYDLKYPWLDTSDVGPVKCCLCKGSHKTQTKRVFLINGTEFRIVNCLKDGLMYLEPQPGLTYVSDLYNHPTYYKGTDEMYGFLVNNKKSRGIAKIRIREIRSFAPDAKTILEIGCGFGHTLLEARKSGFEKADGIEFSKEALTACEKAGLNVRRGDDKLSLKNAKGKYEIIAAYSVLEHLYNPFDFVKSVKRFLKAGGLVFFRVPETDSKGPYLSLVDHFWHFTKKSLNRILERSGFEIIDVFESGIYVGPKGGRLKNMTAVAKLKSK